MHPEPDDRAVTERMRTAHQRACTELGVTATTAEEAWGWRGRTLSRPVTTTDGPAWLRLASAPIGQVALTFWDGSLEAEKLLPAAALPRPRLRHVHDWNDQAWQYRAELYDYIAARPVSASPVLTTSPDLPPSWWTALRTALDTVAAISINRRTITQQYLDRAMPKYLGTPIDTTVRAWTTAHGDLHWANLSAPHLHIFDWEGWGLAPTGYDAAMLHTHSLLVPDTTMRVRTELLHALDTQTGRFAELVTITELLHSTARGDNLPLIGPLRQRAAQLIQRARGSEA